MRANKLREKLNAGEPTLATHVHTTWPSVVEVLGHTGLYDYVEFVAEYGPFDLYALDDFCRAVELYDMGAMIKIDQAPPQLPGPARHRLRFPERPVRRLPLG